MIQIMIPIVEQIADVYSSGGEWTHDKLLPFSRAIRYFSTMIKKGNILTYAEGGKLLGYGEFWRINFEQLGRLVCHASFIATEENTTSGNIAYLAGVWIDPQHRHKNVLKILGHF